MTKPDLICVAAVAGAHGVHGNIKIKSFTAEPADFARYGPLLDEKGQHLFTPKSARPVSRFFSLSAKERLTREALEGMKATKLFVPRSALPAVDDDEFYYSDLLGLSVETDAGEIVGEIAAVHEFGAGDMLEIRPPSGPSFFHPFTQNDTPKVDMAARRVVIIPLPPADDEVEPDQQTSETATDEALKADKSG